MFPFLDHSREESQRNFQVPLSRYWILLSSVFVVFRVFFLVHLRPVIDCWFVVVLHQREFAMPRRTTIWPSTRKSMCQICKWSSWCRASNLRSTFARHLPGCITTGTSQTMALSFWGLTWISLQKLSRLLWRNKLSPLVDHLVAHLETAHGKSSALLMMISSPLLIGFCWVLLLACWVYSVLMLSCCIIVSSKRRL